MACMTTAQQENFLGNLRGVVFNLVHSLHNYIDNCFEVVKPDEISKADYKAYIFNKNEIDDIPALLDDFEDVCLAAARIFVESDCKLPDLIKFEVLLDEAMKVFILNSLQYGIQIKEDFFVAKAFKKNVLDIASSSKVFFEQAVEKTKSTCFRVAEKMGISESVLKKSFKVNVELLWPLICDLKRKEIATQLHLTQNACEDKKTYAERCDEALKTLSMLQQKMLHIKVSSLILDEKEHEFDPLFVFENKVEIAFSKYMSSECASADLDVLKKAIEVATAACAARYQTIVEPTVLDYIKAGFIALTGILLGLATFPIVALFPDYKDRLNLTFFSGGASKVVDSEQSKTIQTEMKEQFFSDEVDAWRAIKVS